MNTYYYRLLKLIYGGAKDPKIYAANTYVPRDSTKD